MTTMYQITQDLAELLEMRDQAIESSDQEQVLMIDQAMCISQDNFKEKALNCAKFIKSEELNIVSIDSEIKRLQALKKSKESKIDYLKSRLSNAMQAFNFTKFDLGIFNLSFRKSESVEVLDVNLLPDEFKRVKTTVEADKIGLKKAINEGRQIAGAFISEKLSLKVG